ncbi:hypothetical protein IWW55_000810 [Coemansia sp. RSA 2706]|nr:hypothetical protein IWW55_000810 [Coemansia sp. RSA 2706]
MPSIEELVTELTTNGSETLDAGQLHELKRQCKGDRSGQTVVLAFHALMQALAKRHAQVRISAVLAVSELFIRSHHFRLLVIGSLPKLFELVFGAYHKKLPPPAQYTQRLRQVAAEQYFMWTERFGDGYQQLIYGFRFLRYVERVDFKAAAAEYRRKDPERARLRRQRRLENRHAYMRRSLVSVQADYARERQNAEEALSTLERCFVVLVPDIFASLNFDVGNAGENDGAYADEDDEDDVDDVLAIMAANRQAIDISIDPDRVLEAEECAENQPVFDVIRDYLLLCVKVFRPRVRMWSEKLGRIDRDLDPTVTQLVEAVDRLKARISVAEDKCRDLGIDFAYMDKTVEGDEDDDEEFEDVPVAEPARPTGNIKKRNAVFAMLGEPVLKNDPTYINPEQLRDRHTTTTSSSDEQRPANPVEDRLRESAPVVSYDSDLMYWGRDSVSVDTTGLEIRHRFLGSARDEPILTGAALDSLKKRAVFYQEPERKEIKACRAPLRDGRLCPRRDLVKCPFHGAIIPRDEQGRLEAGYMAEETPPPVRESEPEPEPQTNTVETAERVEDLRWQDVEKLVNKPTEKPKKRERTLASTRKPKLSGIKRLKQTIGRKR